VCVSIPQRPSCIEVIYLQSILSIFQDNQDSPDELELLNLSHVQPSRAKKPKRFRRKQNVTPVMYPGSENIEWLNEILENGGPRVKMQKVKDNLVTQFKASKSTKKDTKSTKKDTKSTKKNTKGSQKSPQDWMDWFVNQSGAEGMKEILAGASSTGMKKNLKPTPAMENFTKALKGMGMVPEDVFANSSDLKKKKRKSTPCIRRRIDHILSPDEITPEMLAKVCIRAKDKKHDQTIGSSCHQCRQKTDDTKTICRSGSCVGMRGCFCGPCLRTKYNEDACIALMDAKWKCPVCRGICTCSLCRKANSRSPPVPAERVTADRSTKSKRKDSLDTLKPVNISVVSQSDVEDSKQTNAAGEKMEIEESEEVCIEEVKIESYDIVEC